MTKLKGVMLAVILVIIVFIVIFNFVGTSSDSLTDAADSITDANNCSEDTITDTTGAALVYNITDKYCYNATDAKYLAGQYDLPLNTLFASNGIVLLVLMAAILIVLVVIALKFTKKK